jgi:predicted RNase H-like HicB family nuclease
MRTFKYVVYQDGKYFVSQCLNVDVSSFGKTIDEAVKNLADAVELYLGRFTITPEASRNL